ncbi:MAG: LuxR C-terminal-related transcriptional regulator [Rhodospirillales bacterium]|nr:LuxR C-terminal-related transcriptional regulator [Rhodospirillales bacterium]
MSLHRPVTIEDALARAVERIGSDAFPAALAGFFRLCAPFDNFIFLAYSGEENPVALYREFKDPVVFHAMDSEYVAAAYLLDPFYRAHLDRVAAGIYRMLDIAPDQFKRTSYFQVYYQKTTLVDEVAAFGYTATGYTITACLGTDRSSGALFSKKAMSTLRRYESVITALIETHWKDLVLDQGDQAVTVRRVLDRLIDTMALRRNIRLSNRQAEVAMMILQGHSSESIGLHLGISPQTVKVFRKQLYMKCGISSQAELFSTMMPLMAEAAGGRFQVQMGERGCWPMSPIAGSST